MCGIAGYKIDRQIDPAVLRKMVEALYHRGPDADGYYEAKGYSAGMRRLMINDIPAGGQPFYNTKRSVIVFYNGEIYNSLLLRQDLEKRGIKFKSHCDGEVIAHLYDLYQEDVFEYLDGMFAIALWDEEKKKLVLGRDIPGEKPLYYYQGPDGSLVFSSEIKSLKIFPSLDLELDRQSIWDFPTFLWVPEPATIYTKIKALLPGHLLVADAKGVAVRPYKNRFNFDDGGDIVTGTHDLVENAIKSRLLSDVPIGCFLSGGLDSSIVTAVARKHVDRLSTFTIGFEDLEDPYHGRSDESIFAQEFAKQLGTTHHTIKVGADDFLNMMGDFCEYGDQPFAVSSGFGILAIAREAQRQGIKVLLSGDGADELFGGYSWYSHMEGLSHLENAGRDQLQEDISFQNFGMPIEERLKKLLNYDAHTLAWAWHYYASENEKALVFNQQTFEDVKDSRRFFKAFNPSLQWVPEKFIEQDRQFYLPNEMLRKVDRMTMAYSVEGRVPFVAPTVLTYVQKLRYTDMVKGDTLKWILRKAFERELPETILSRKKHGFNVPIDHWLKGDWKFLVQETFSKGSFLMRKGFLSHDAANQAQRMLADPKRLNGHTIFCYVMLNRWLERNV